MNAVVKDVNSLLCDIGNSSLKLGLAAKTGIADVFTLPCGKCVTPDSLAIDILQILNIARVKPEQLQACLCCSVAPGMGAILKKAVSRFSGCRFLSVPGDVSIPLKNKYERPEEAGADRLVAAWGCRINFPDFQGLVIADFGSVSTFDCVNDNAWLGGLLFPGLAAAMKAMSLAAPGLPELSTVMGACAETCEPCASTRKAMITGVLHGFSALSKGLCAQLRKSLPEPVKVVATGGCASVIAGIAPIFDAVLPNLVLEGLAALYYEKT